ncbi:hypothetical protein BN903_358 [Halorubrum sp. AJ67]|nr:hypothetical protein BN903_358 [Halorubrum sp. AJ67]
METVIRTQVLDGNLHPLFVWFTWTFCVVSRLKFSLNSVSSAADFQ